jgi:hypothetical protein
MTRAADLAKLIAGGGTITVADNSDTLTLESTDADANVGPVLNLHRNSASPADNDLLGRIVFKADDDAGNESTFARIEATATDVTNGSEDCRLDFISVTDDSSTATMSISSNKVGIGVTPAKGMLHIQPSARTTNFSASDHTTYADIYVHNPTDDDTCATGIAFATDASSFDNGASGIACISGTGDSESSLAFITRPNGVVATERMRIDSDGHVGIGTTDPQVGLQVEASDGSVNGTIRLTATGVASAGMAMDANGLNFGADTGGFLFKTGATANDPSDTGTTRMSINSSGLVDIGAIGHTSSSMLDVASPNLSSTANGITVQNKTDNTGGYFVAFYRSNNALIGNISQGSGSVAYNTTSDYRLKENVVTDWDATTRLKQLKPSRFNFKEFKDTTVDGFLAHEVSSIVPEAITGTKDEVDTDDNPVYQGIDHSKLVPLMVKTIQELEARIATLESK